MENQGYPPQPPYYYQDDEISITDIIRNLKKWAKELYRRRFFILKWAATVAATSLLFWVVTSAMEPTTYIDRKYFTIERTTMSQLGELKVTNENFDAKGNLTEYQEVIKSTLLRSPKVTETNEKLLVNEIIETYQMEGDAITKIGDALSQLTPIENKSLLQVIQRTLGLNIRNEFDEEENSLIKIVPDTLVFDGYSGVSKIETNTINPNLSTSLKEEIYQELQSSYLAHRDELLQTEISMRESLLDTIIAERNLASIKFNQVSKQVQHERNVNSSLIIRNATPITPDEFISKELLAQFEIAQKNYLDLEDRSKQLKEQLQMRRFAIENELIQFKEISDLDDPIQFKPLSISVAIEDKIFEQSILYFVISSLFLTIYILSSMAFRNVAMDD